ncbi:MAG: hypothetical protein CVU02_01040 [Bacteroidetes bacterium HGW-Bacteroidetes-19]|nr:MAG: hypothetical protein CVU04_02675 [Bacteroidetes bacterium HGW-Bacteroidetes-20]PKP28391.1 MAG: hypothetical protein CVU02_01040 [Bacteroidetes bacterium HGW-Bacteroidetes-19]
MNQININQFNTIDGIIVAAVGGAIAGLVIWIAELIRQCFLKKRHTNRIEKWLEKNSNLSIPLEWRSTRAIASHNNLTEDRIRFICSHSNKIQLNTADGNNSDELWKFIQS